MIPYGRQSIDEDDIAAVVAVLRGDWLTQGPTVDEFERDLAALVGSRHAVAFSSGTAALHATMAAAEMGPGDRVATSPLTFAASASCARYVGATPVFVDVDPATYNLDPLKVPEDVSALIAVHYAGLPMDLSLLPRRPRIVIEDAAQALGAMTRDGPVGNCARSDMCVFSFHPVKTITTAEGGAVTTNSAELAETLRRFRNHGIVRKPDHGDWYFEVESIGFNYRLTDVHAALGKSQLKKVESFIERRNALAERYRRVLDAGEVVPPPEAGPGVRHAYHLFPVRVPRRREVFDGMRARGIGVQVHHVPAYRHPLFGCTGDLAKFPQTEQIYAGLLSLPLHPELTADDQDRVVDTLMDVLADQREGAPGLSP